MSERAEITNLLFELGRVMRTRFEKGRGPSFLQLATLHFVIEQQKPSLREVAAYLKIKPPTASVLVEELVKGGLVTRAPDPDDARSVQLAVTRKGRALYRSQFRQRMLAMDTMLERLTPKELNHLSRMLNKILNPSQK